MNYAALPASQMSFTKLSAQRVRLAQWAFGAAVRLSDQNRPLALKLCIECMIVARSLMLLLSATPAASRPARRAAHPRRPQAAVVRRAVQVRPAVVNEREVPRSAGRRCAGRRCAGRRCAARRCTDNARAAPSSASGRRLSASVQQRSAFLCMVGLHG